MNPDEAELEILCNRYLAEGYAYEVLGRPYVSDNMFDTMCRIIHHNWNRVPDWFKELQNRDAIKSGSALGSKWRQKDIETSNAELTARGVWDLD